MRNPIDIPTPAIPGAPQARARRLAVGLAAAALLLGALPWTSAEAQQRRSRVSTIKVDDGTSPSQTLPAARQTTAGDAATAAASVVFVTTAGGVLAGGGPAATPVMGSGSPAGAGARPVMPAKIASDRGRSLAARSVGT